MWDATLRTPRCLGSRAPGEAWHLCPCNEERGALSYDALNRLTNLAGGIVQERIFEDFLEKVGGYVDTPIAVILRKQLSVYQGGFLQPDLADPGITQTGIGQVYEIKSIYSEQLAIAKVALYAGVLNLFDPVRRWIPGVTYEPPSIIRVEPGTVGITSLAAPGVITYCLINELEVAALAMLALAGLFSEIEVNFGAAALEEEYAF